MHFIWFIDDKKSLSLNKTGSLMFYEPFLVFQVKPIILGSFMYWEFYELGFYFTLVGNSVNKS